MMELDQFMRLRDGRKLGFGEYGHPNGNPIFFFHGTPGSRKMRHPDTAIAESAGARIITVDRPGYGLSDPMPGRRFLDWPKDIIQLADHLNIGRFRIIGFSGGGAYAAACAFECADRVAAITLVCSAGPPETMNPPDSMIPFLRLLFRGARLHPGVLVLGTPLVHIMKLSFNFWYDRIVNRFPESDREILIRPEIRSVFRESIAEAFLQGTPAFRTELRLLAREWDIPLSGIRTPVFLWHGTVDPFYNGTKLASLFHEGRLTLLPEGHLVLFRHWKEILEQLL